MSFDDDLRRELDRVGIDGARARRIADELADHRACDPRADLGEPRELAERFAAELRLPLTRRAAWAGLGSLALTAALLCVAAVAASGPSQNVDLFGTRGTIAALGGLLIVIAAQVAFVAGTLALAPVWRCRAPDLAQRRLRVALGAGVAVAAGEAVQAAALAPYVERGLLALTVVAFAVPLAATAAAGRALRAAGAITPRRDDAHAWPQEMVAACALLAVAAMTIGSAFAEHSWAEGLSRGLVEAVAIAACYAALGRRVGLRA